MSWTNPFANQGSGLTEGQVQGIVDDVSISPIYTSQIDAQTNLNSYEIVRVNLSTDEIELPDGLDGLHVRIMNVKNGDLVVKDSSGIEVCTMYMELVSFVYKTDTWITFSSY